METKVYVDVLLAINYIVNLLLVRCTAKLTGFAPKRRRIVAAALFGSVSALTIFFPYWGFLTEIALRILLAAAIVRIAFPFANARAFAKQIFVFFAVSFFFSGVMLAVWMAFTPSGMVYYNGVVYFDISSVTLILTTAVAYGALSLLNRFARGGRIRTAVYTAEIAYRGRKVAVRALVDTGNSLYEPFSDTPVMVCRLTDVAPLLPPGVEAAIRSGEHLGVNFGDYRFPVRLIPYRNVGGNGMIPAFRPDALTLAGEGEILRVEQVFVGVTTQKIGGTGFDAILNPDLIGVKI